MSSNDQIVITKKGNIYKAYYNGCVDNDFRPDKCTPIATAKTHESITKKAKEWYRRDNFPMSPEYGIVYTYSTKTVEV